MEDGLSETVATDPAGAASLQRTRHTPRVLVPIGLCTINPPPPGAKATSASSGIIAVDFSLPPTMPSCRRSRRTGASSVLAFLALATVAAARAEDAPQPAAAPSAQRSGAAGEHNGALPNSPPGPHQHRQPPHSTPTQTLARSRRSLAFSA